MKDKTRLVYLSPQHLAPSRGAAMCRVGTLSWVFCHISCIRYYCTPETIVDRHLQNTKKEAEQHLSPRPFKYTTLAPSGWRTLPYDTGSRAGRHTSCKTSAYFVRARSRKGRFVISRRQTISLRRAWTANSTPKRQRQGGRDRAEAANVRGNENTPRITQRVCLCVCLLSALTAHMLETRSACGRHPPVSLPLVPFGVGSEFLKKTDRFLRCNIKIPHDNAHEQFYCKTGTRSFRRHDRGCLAVCVSVHSRGREGRRFLLRNPLSPSLPTYFSPQAEFPPEKRGEPPHELTLLRAIVCSLEVLLYSIRKIYERREKTGGGRKIHVCEVRWGGVGCAD